MHKHLASILSLVLSMVMLAPLALGQARTISVLPQPAIQSVTDGVFVLKPETSIVSDKANQLTAKMLARWLTPATGYPFKAKVTEDTDNTISLKLDPSLTRLGNEGYLLDVTPQRVTIRAQREAGVFYGVQTLRMLVPPAIFSTSVKANTVWELPAMHIEDQPRFGWRGAMLDVSRHFMPRDFVLQFIDLLALHKLNTFHWHLTDDQGWRIEIKKYPRLTQVGAWRRESRLGHEGRQQRGFDKQPHGGFYTQREIREVVEYARQRHITVVPEIEMPGHAQAAIAAYPELGVKDEPVEVWTRWGVNPNIFNPNEKTILFMQDVLSEVIKLFPSTFVHVGGDEATKEWWKASPQVQARLKELGLKDEHEGQSYFIGRMDKFLTSKGRRLIGWDEILEGGLAPGATVMSWRGVKGGITAAKAGHDVVMAPTTHTYLDYYQSQEPGELPAIGGHLPLETVYSFEPIPAELNADESRHVLGTQAQIWTEYLPTPGHVEYMAFPRLIALAEVAWSPRERKNYADFLTRLSVHEERLQLLRVNFRPTKKAETK